MTDCHDLNEPANGGYVAIRFHTGAFAVYRRRDDWAEANRLGEAHWFCQSNPDAPALTWVGLTDLGDLAYVGQFVDRQSGVAAR